MAASIYWFKLASLFMCYSEMRLAAHVRMSKQFPCDVNYSTKDDVTVSCNGRQLKEIPHGIPKDTKYLHLEENHIANISQKAFWDLQNLTLLSLNWMNKNYHTTHTADGAFMNLINLQELRMNGNGLKQIPNQLPTTLEILMLDNNKIISLNKSKLSGIKNIIKLFVSKNCFYGNPCGTTSSIYYGTFSELTDLQELSLNDNNLTQVPQGLPKSLQKLQLASNKIQYISRDDFHNLTNLRVLRLQGNCPRCKNAPYPCVPCPNISLEIHPDAFHDLTNLETLQLAGNSLKIVHSSWFKSLTNLKDLFLSYNLLSAAISKDVFLSNLPNLERLDISFNFQPGIYPKTIHLSKQFSTFVSLKTLHIEGLVFREINDKSLEHLYGLRNLSVLNVGTNFIVSCDSTIFSKFSDLRLIYLSENRIYPVTVSGSSRYNSGRISESVSFTPPLLEYQSNQKERSYEITHSFVKQECYDSGRVLSLSSNNLFFISPKQFEPYKDIACLNLSRNGFAAAPNGSEFKSLPDLKYLDLSFNKIDLAYDNAFSELKKLEVIDLSYNPHYFTVSGVTHNLNFLENLPALRVLNLSHNNIFTLTTKKMKSTSLRELQFVKNNLGTLWKDESYYKLFQNLVHLTYLDISFNFISSIPNKVFIHLPSNITKLSLSHNSLKEFQWHELKHFKELREINISFNSLDYVSAELSKFTQTLQLLDLSFNNIAQLSDGFLKGAKSLTTLDLSHNQLTLINQTTFLSSPENYLKILYLQGNPFQCTCDLLEFILWIDNNDVKIPRLPIDVTCSMPAERKGEKVIFFDIQECVNDNIAFLIYFLSTSIILLTMIMGITTHVFYWDASYFLHYLKAKLKGYYPLTSTDSAYEAFIAYDTSDPQVSEWVMNHLRVHLEESGEKHLPLCLENRDWIPGTPLLDNLYTSIRQSRKTVFVLTETYVTSGAFKMAIYLAHQRLLDENVDVTVLLLLEPVLQYSPFLRLRRRLCGSSVLEWPRAAAAEPWFWQCLRNAIRVDNQVMYSNSYSRYFSQTEEH
ncbi:toll-like receptor 8 [Hypomesus transpacificus]|uniref:toll-like receptor 8 n=1 Tax=Hypomesus transpacificus TaxID=137520 RepID=UPI001F0739F5|nr:toll-like receptor 8 [Hypomesus transpacificus]